MRAFLCGGGSGVQVQEAYNKLNEIIDKSKPLLYVPLATSYDEYDSCFEWITEELKDFDSIQIDMVRSARALYEKSLNEYCAIFINNDKIEVIGSRPYYVF